MQNLLQPQRRRSVFGKGLLALGFYRGHQHQHQQQGRRRQQTSGQWACGEHAPVATRQHQGAAQRVNGLACAQRGGVGKQHQAVGQQGVFAQDFFKGIERLVGIDRAMPFSPPAQAGAAVALAASTARLSEGVT